MATEPRSYTTDVDPAASARKASVGRQALRRDVNERAADVALHRGAERFEVLCECGLTGCDARFAVDGAAYEAARRLPTHFVLDRRHAEAGERVVHDAGAYLVVEKFGRAGVAAVRASRGRWARR